MKHSFFLFIFFSVVVVRAEAVLVVSNKAFVKEIKKDDIQDLFSGRKRMIGEQRVDLVDQAQPNLRELFYRLLLNRTPTQINISWAELVFSGRAKAPVSVTDSSDVINFIMKN